MRVHQICQQKLTGPPHFCQQIYWFPPNLPADVGVISAGRFGDCNQYICQQKHPLILLPEVYWMSPNLLAAMGRSVCQQIWWQSVKSAGSIWWQSHVSGVISAGRFGESQTKSASRFGNSQSNLLASQFCWKSVISASRNTDFPHISVSRFVKFSKPASQIYWQSVNLLADLVILIPCLPASMGEGYMCWQTFGECHHICQQIWWQSHQNFCQ